MYVPRRSPEFAILKRALWGGETTVEDFVRLSSPLSPDFPVLRLLSRSIYAVGDRIPRVNQLFSGGDLLD
jgi:hypothetical protein